MHEDCILITSKDVSESFENQFKAEVNEYKINMLSSFSHELRTPLNGAISPLEIALKNSDIPKIIKESNINNALTSLFLLENTLNDIIDLTSICANQF